MCWFHLIVASLSPYAFIAAGVFQFEASARPLIARTRVSGAMAYWPFPDPALRAFARATDRLEAAVDEDRRETNDYPVCRAPAPRDMGWRMALPFKKHPVPSPTQLPARN